MKFRNPWVSATERLLTKDAEHALYEKAANDIESSNIHKGIWTKAFSLSDGNEQKQKAKYIELMVEYYKDLILAGEELEDIIASEEDIIKKREAQDKVERDEIAKREKEQALKQKEHKEIWEKEKKQKEEHRQYLATPEYKERIKKEKRLFLIAGIVLISVVALLQLNKEFSKKMTYECGSGDNKEIVVRESDDLIINKTTGRNSYNMNFDRQKDDNFIVYTLWQSITGEGYMYKVDTNELGQLEPKQLCVYIGQKRFQ
jgi:hypothetical protein